MIRYNFHILKQKKDADLPEDVNEQCEKSAELLKDPSLKEAIINVRKKKLFGKLTKSGEINGQIVDIAEYEFQYGICPHYKLTRPLSPTVRETRTILNSKVDFKKL